MPIEIHEFRSIDRALRWVQEEGAKGFCWYRGHSKASYELVPRAMRADCRNSENNLYREFMQAAPGIQSGIAYPRSQYDPRWFAIMQHYGVPTRCLDWSTSLLTVLYFACTSNDNVANSTCNGAVWLLNTKRFSGLALSEFDKSVDMSGLLGDDSGMIAEMLRLAILRDDRKTPFALPFKPPFKSPREYAQRGVFTVHRDHEPLERHPRASEFLKKMIIRRDVKETLIELLYIAGVDAAALFPELPHLAERLRRRTK